MAVEPAIAESPPAFPVPGIAGALGAGAAPWRQLPTEVATVLRPLLPTLADEIIVAVRAVPAYSRPLEGDFGIAIHAGVRAALDHMVSEIEASGPVPRSDVYRQLGRGEMRAGRSLESLLSAYRIGARVAWRRLAAAGQLAGLAPETLYRLAEAIFAYIDVLSAESAEGHARERSLQAGETEMLRRQLVRTLVRRPSVEPARLRAAAASAQWPLPDRLAVLAIAPAGQTDVSSRAHRVALRLPPGTLTEAIGELLCVIVSDPDAPGRRTELTRALDVSGRRGALGSTVAPEQAATSYLRAQAALALGRAAPLVSARELAGELLLGGDPELATEFAADRLAPLDGLGEGARQRLLATLAAWLAHQGRLNAVAANLQIHPQTARYRLARLRDHFGDALDDPEQRFWLAVALRLNGVSG